ncbi:MAG: hypothetical protein M0C28_44335 [Candidatus Moduliflexus flocculans]|nr:hypothetical protein [Candidatus Moduliflexus flocculans]
MKPMDDSELVKRDTGLVMRFARSERFFPMAVEPYLERCHLIPSGPQGAVEMLLHLTEPVKARDRQTAQRGVFPALRQRSFGSIPDIWIWWGMLCQLPRWAQAGSRQAGAGSGSRPSWR